MNFIEYLGIAFAPSLTLGLVIFFARNWFLERLKNSIKHEYDLSLEKFKGELKHDNDKSLENLKADLKSNNDLSLEKFKGELKHDNDKLLEKFKGELKLGHDKELEDLKAILKKQTDVNLEDYRFQIEIRKKWIEDFKHLSSNFIDKVKENVDINNKYILNSDLLLKKNEDKFNLYKETMHNIAQRFAELKTIKFKIELLIIDCDQYGSEIFKSMCFIENWIYTEVDPFAEKLFDFKSDEFLPLKEHEEAFKNNVKKLLQLKSEKL